MNENEELQSGFPDWLTEDYKVMEPVFCRTFLREHPMRCIRGRFYTVNGLVADDSSLKKDIHDQISPWLETKIARKVDELLNALRMAACSEPIEFSCFIAQNADAYRLEATNNVYIGSGKRCRGYLGIEVLIRPNAL